MITQSDSARGWELNSDKELWMAFSSGNRQAFSVLFIRFYDRLFRYGMNLYPYAETVKDSIQSLFLRLWKKRSKLEVPDSVSGYLYISLRRTLFRSKEKQTMMSKRHDEYTQYTFINILDMEHAMIDGEEEKERKMLLQQAIASLTSRQKEALLLRIDSGLSNQEIAGIMEISDKRVRNLIYEAVKGLREYMYNRKAADLR